MLNQKEELKLPKMLILIVSIHKACEAYVLLTQGIESTSAFHDWLHAQAAVPFDGRGPHCCGHFGVPCGTHPASERRKVSLQLPHQTTARPRMQTRFPTLGHSSNHHQQIWYPQPMQPTPSPD